MGTWMILLSSFLWVLFCAKRIGILECEKPWQLRERETERERDSKVQKVYRIDSKELGCHGQKQNHENGKFDFLFVGKIDYFFLEMRLTNRRKIEWWVEK